MLGNVLIVDFCGPRRMSEREDETAEARAKGYIPVNCPDAVARFDNKRLLFAVKELSGAVAVATGVIQVREYPFTSVTVIVTHAPYGATVQDSFFLGQEAVDRIESIDHPSYEFHIPPPFVLSRDRDN